MILLASAAASLLNPQTYRVILNPFEVFLRGRSELMGIGEYQSPLAWGGAAPRSLYMIALGALLAINWKKAKTFDIFLTAAFTVFGLMAIRNYKIYALLTAPVLAASIGGLLDRPVFSRIARPAGALAAAAVLAAALWQFIAVDFMERGLIGFGVSRWPILPPDGAIAFLEKENQTGNVLPESFGWGNYITWRGYPGLKTFMDGRNEIYEDRVYKAYMEVLQAGPNWKRALDDFNVEFLLLRPSTSDQATVRDLIFADPGWAPVYFDDLSILYARRGRRIGQWASRMALGPANPDETRFSREMQEKSGDPAWLASVDREMTAALERAPGSAKAHHFLGLVKFMKGDIDGAIARFNAAAGGPEFRERVHYNLAVCYLKKSKIPEAITELKLELRGGSGNEKARALLEKLEKQPD